MRLLREISPLDHAVRRRQNLQIVATFAALVALVLLVNFTPVSRWVCEVFGLSAEEPASLLGRAYWDDCFGGPLGSAVAGTLPRPDDLGYTPEADEFLAAHDELAAQEEAAQGETAQETA